jgi:23S rRNA pseudouridine1911/1915/1917 synthase
VRYLVGLEHVGERLDRVVAAVTGTARRRSRVLVDEGRVWLNSTVVRVLSRPVHLGDVIDVIAGEETLAPSTEPPPRLDIVHEDGWLVAVNKPAGLASQPPRDRRPGELTVPEALTLQLGERDGRRPDLLLFHRLDRITSGVLVLARHHESARALSAAWAAGTAEKTYLAIVRGAPGPDEIAITDRIGRDRLTPGRFRPDRSGKPARTLLRRLSAAPGLALVMARPLTGRSHQVRVHLAEAGTPVAGDRLYAGGGGVPRPFLHAWRLALPHPRGGETLRLEAPLPADMLSFLAANGLLTGLQL